jgi:hypothetical protein
VLYANTVRTIAGGAGDPAEVRSCDALVIGALFGEAHHVFPPLARVMDETCAWATAQLAAQCRPVLFVDGLLDGLEVASTLAARGVAVSAHRSIRDAASRAIPGAASRAELEAISTVGKEPRAIVWLDSDHAGLAKAMRGDAKGRASSSKASSVSITPSATSFATALVSGRAIEGSAGYDAAFVWATAADRTQLLTWIEAAGARAVFVTGPCADAIAAAVGPHARVIGPPQQMALFAR